MLLLRTKNDNKRNPNLIVPIIYDDIFKRVFGSEENADITAYLVSLLLKIPYEKVKGNIVFKSTKQDNYRVNDKLAKKDIVFIVNIEEPLKLNLEMNRSFSLSKSIIDRNVYYESNLFGSGLRQENEYKDLKMTIQYNFNLDFVDRVEEPVIDEYLFRNERGNILTEKTKIVHINILKMRELWYNGKYKTFTGISPNLFALASLLVENEKKEFQKIVDEVPIKTDIKEKIERIVSDMNFDDELIEKYYDLDEEREKMLRATFEEIYEAKLQKDLQKKLQEESQKLQEKFQNKSKELQEKFQNESKELQKEKDKTIFTMYKNGLSVDLIAKYTHISIKNINEIIKRNKEDN